MLTLTVRKNDKSPSDRRIQIEYIDQTQFQQGQIQQNIPISNTPQQNKQVRGYKNSETLLSNKTKNKFARKSTDAMKEIQEDQQSGTKSNKGSNRVIENKNNIPLIKEEDETFFIIIFLISYQKIQYNYLITYWNGYQSKKIQMNMWLNGNKEQLNKNNKQTLNYFILNIGLPNDIQQKLIEAIPILIQQKNANQLSEDQNNLLKQQQSFRNVVQKYGFGTERVSSNQTKNHISIQSQESLLKNESDDDQIQRGSKQGSQKQMDNQRIKKLNFGQKSTKFLKINKRRILIFKGNHLDNQSILKNILIRKKFNRFLTWLLI